MAVKSTQEKAKTTKTAHPVSIETRDRADFLFAPVGAFLTLRDRGTEIFSELVEKGRKAEPRIRREVGKIRDRVEGLDLKIPEWLRIRLETSSHRARKTWEELNLPETLKNLEVKDRVEKIRTRIQGIVR